MPALQNCQKKGSAGLKQNLSKNYTKIKPVILLVHHRYGKVAAAVCIIRSVRAGRLST